MLISTVEQRNSYKTHLHSSSAVGVLPTISSALQAGRSGYAPAPSSEGSLVSEGVDSWSSLEECSSCGVEDRFVVSEQGKQVGADLHDALAVSATLAGPLSLRQVVEVPDPVLSSNG